MIDELQAQEPKGGSGKLKSFTISELLKMNIPPQEWILYPFIAKEGMSILCAERGGKKTFSAITLACAAATGINCFNFVGGMPQKVVYIDAELNRSSIKQRFDCIVKGFDKQGVTINTDNIKMIAANFQNSDVSLPNLAKPDEQDRLEPELEGADLIIIDSVYFLYQMGKENDSESWRMFNDWSAMQKRKGRAVLWVVHAGKGEKLTSRGSSAIETQADAILFLKKSDTGATSFEYTKWRLTDDGEVENFTAKLVGDKSDKRTTTALYWNIVESDEDKIMKALFDMKQGGKTYKQIEKETGVKKSTAERKIKEYKEKIDK